MLVGFINGGEGVISHHFNRLFWSHNLVGYRELERVYGKKLYGVWEEVHLKGSGKEGEAKRGG